MEEMAGENSGKFSQNFPNIYIKNIMNRFIFTTYKIIIIHALFKIIFFKKDLLQYIIKIIIKISKL